MPTRSEILEALGEEIDELGSSNEDLQDAMETVAADFCISADQLVEALNTNAQRNENTAAENLGNTKGS